MESASDSIGDSRSWSSVESIPTRKSGPRARGIPEASASSSQSLARTSERFISSARTPFFAPSVTSKKSQPAGYLVATEKSQRMPDRPDVVTADRRRVDHAEQFVGQRDVAAKHLLDLGVACVRVAHQLEKFEGEDVCDRQISARQRLRRVETIPLEQLESEIRAAVSLDSVANAHRQQADVIGAKPSRQIGQHLAVRRGHVDLHNLREAKQLILKICRVLAAYREAISAPNQLTAGLE